MKFLIFIIGALLFRFGGQDQVKWLPWNQKLNRWLMGIILGLFFWKGWVLYGCTIITYLIATNLFGYGEKTPILKYLPKVWKFAVSGFMFGLASVFMIGWWSLLQAFIGAVSFVIIMYLDDNNKVKNPWVELLRGGTGTCLTSFF